MYHTIYGIPHTFVEQYLSQVDSEKQKLFLIEACADLIEAVSKHARTHDNADEIIEEMGHTILSCAILSHQLDISETDILKVVQKLGEKKGVKLVGNDKFFTLTRSINGLQLSFPLSLTEQEEIFRNRKLVYLMNDAERHLMEIIYEDVADDENADQVFIDTYGCTPQEMCDPGSQHFALAYLSDRFEDLTDEDTAVNDTWRTIIKEMLEQYKTGNKEADAVAAGAGGYDCFDTVLNTSNNVEQLKQLVALINSADGDCKYICFNAPLDDNGWDILNKLITEELATAINNGKPFTDLSEFAAYICKLFCKTSYASENAITQWATFQMDDRTPYWQRSVDFENTVVENPAWPEPVGPIPATPAERTPIVQKITLPNGSVREVSVTLAAHIDHSTQAAFTSMLELILDDTAVVDSLTTDDIRQKIRELADSVLPTANGDPIVRMSIHDLKP